MAEEAGGPRKELPLGTSVVCGIREEGTQRGGKHSTSDDLGYFFCSLEDHHVVLPAVSERERGCEASETGACYYDLLGRGILALA